MFTNRKFASVAVGTIIGFAALPAAIASTHALADNPWGKLSTSDTVVLADNPWGRSSIPGTDSVDDNPWG